MFKKLCVALVATMATITPVGAEVQPGTSSLLDTISSNGILVTINHDDCLTNGSNGQYRWLGFQREMRLCPGRTVDADDHNTVRHETIHAIQHCVNAARGTSTDAPIINTPDDFAEFVMANLTQEDIEWVKSMYPESQWLTELEAFAGANAYTSAELEKLFLDACTLQETAG